MFLYSFKVVTLPNGGAALILEYIEMKGGLSKYPAILGNRLARYISAFICQFKHKFIYFYLICNIYIMTLFSIHVFGYNKDL